MRIVVAAITGVLIAALMSYGVVHVSTSSAKDPVVKPLYNYGNR